MLKQLGYASLDELTDTAVPDDIKLNRSAEAESILGLQTVSQSRTFSWLKLPTSAFTFKAIPTMRRRQRLCVIFGNLRLKLYCREQNSAQWEHYTTILTFKYFCD